MRKNKILIILMILLTTSINSYATPLVKPEINQVKFWSGKWHIGYSEIKNGTNLLKEELFVDGNSDRVVTIGTTEKRGFPLHGSYDLDTCHKAYILVYDKEQNIASKSNVFNFGNLSKCDGLGDNDTIVVKPEIYQIKSWSGKWHIGYSEIKNGTNLLKEELFVDGNSDRVVTIGTTEKRGFPLHGSYDLDTCHKAYILVYDKEQNIASKSNIFNFGNLSKCDGMGDTDTTNPVITLKGDNPQIIKVGNEYRELGAIAFDSVDGDLSASVNIDTTDLNLNSILTSRNLGEHEIYYSVVDAAGNDVIFIRTVKVVENFTVGLEIHNMKFYKGKWYIRYQDLKKVKNLKKEILFVDGNEVRTVTGGYNRSNDRGFAFAGDGYAKDTCHKAYIVAYDYDDNNLSQSDMFEFGDVSKCAVVIPNAPSKLQHNNYEKSMSFRDNSTNETGFNIYNDGFLVKTIPAHEGKGTIEFYDFETYTVSNITVKAFNDAGESEASNRLIANLNDDAFAASSVSKTKKTGLYKVESKSSDGGSISSHEVKFFYLKDGKITYAPFEVYNFNWHMSYGYSTALLTTDTASNYSYKSISDSETFLMDIKEETITYDINDLLNISILTGTTKTCTKLPNDYREEILATYKVWSTITKSWETIYDKSVEDKEYSCDHQF